MAQALKKISRSEMLAKAAITDFDVCIIGGGATGAGCALDAALRGMKVILIEKNDFGSATSGKSTKLIHGGVRYLEQAVKKIKYPAICNGTESTKRTTNPTKSSTTHYPSIAFTYAMPQFF